MVMVANHVTSCIALIAMKHRAVGFSRLEKLVRETLSIYQY